MTNRRHGRGQHFKTGMVRKEQTLSEVMGMKELEREYEVKVSFQVQESFNSQRRGKYFSGGLHLHVY